MGPLVTRDLRFFHSQHSLDEHLQRSDRCQYNLAAYAHGLDPSNGKVEEIRSNCHLCSGWHVSLALSKRSQILALTMMQRMWDHNHESRPVYQTQHR